MWIQIWGWLCNNAIAIFISAIASLLISKWYYDKANRENVLMTVIFPAVKLLEQKYYTRKDYEALFDINSSYASKYLRKRERNALLELLSAYRDVCRYTKEDADANCIMSYYVYKLKEKGINPKPCVIRDNDGEIVADDFPPDYNYLQNYVYEIVSSYEFIENPAECSEKIADAFKRYTKKYYGDDEIIYFKDYSIEKVIDLSEVSKTWNKKFEIADERKENFLKLPICKKTKEIIDKTSVNKYIKNKKKVKDIVSKRINSLKNTKYSSVYVVVCLIEQTVILEMLKDMTRLISDKAIASFVYVGGGLVSLVIMLIVLEVLIKRSGKQIERDALKEGENSEEDTSGKDDKIVECATMIGYMSPLLCLSTWIAEFSGLSEIKWVTIALVHILGVGVPLVIKKSYKKIKL